MTRKVQIELEGPDADAFLEWWSQREGASVGAAVQASGNRSGGEPATRRARRPARKVVSGRQPIRDWAKEHGFPNVKPKGPIPSEIVEAYAKAH